MLDEYLPKTGTGSILLTSRDTALATNYGGRELDVLDKKSAIDLLFIRLRDSGQHLSVRTPENEAAAAQIVGRIGYLPLAIGQVASLITKERCPIPRILEAYSNREIIEDVEDLPYAVPKKSNYPHSLKTVWNMNFERLERDQQKLVNLLAFMDPDGISFNLLSDGAAASQLPALAFINTPRKFNKCRGPVVSSSLVIQDDTAQKLRLHRLVQEICHIRMSDVDRQEAFDMAVTIIKAVWPIPLRHNRHRPELWPKQQSYLPHVQSICHFYQEALRESQLQPRSSKMLQATSDFPRCMYEASW